MLTAEQIFDRILYPAKASKYDQYIRTLALKAMEEYAKQRVQILEEALENIMQMKLEGGEVDYRFAFNRCWHAANEALNQYRNALQT